MENENFDFNVDAYLGRIGLSESVNLTEDGIVQLHRAQAYSIPFENFDIQLGRNIELSPQTLFDKLVSRPRGGYCFELNGLFLLALRQFGFEARPLLARVHLGGVLTARTHQLILVTIDGRDWIADVGFGASGLRDPIPIELGRVATQDGLKFRLMDKGPIGIMLQTEGDGYWEDLYSFDLMPVYDVDIAMGNHFTQTYPESFFTYARVATLPNATGRISLMNYSLNKVSGNNSATIELEPGPAYLAAIEESFGIRLDEGYESLRPV